MPCTYLTIVHNLIHSYYNYFCFSTKVDRIWGLMAKMVLYGYKGLKKIYGQVSKKGVTKKMMKHLYMASHISEIKRLLKLKWYIYKLQDIATDKYVLCVTLDYK